MKIGGIPTTPLRGIDPLVSMVSRWIPVDPVELAEPLTPVFGGDQADEVPPLVPSPPEGVTPLRCYHLMGVTPLRCYPLWVYLVTGVTTTLADTLFGGPIA